MKAASKQFDLSVVYRLSMPNKGLRRIENLDQAPNLTELDLSHNKLIRIEGLEGLDSLKRLVLSHNELERVEGIDQLDQLETLTLHGNHITNLDDMQSLSTLPCLRHVQLQVIGAGKDDRNPVCDHPAYRAAMRRMFPQLQTLDGERTVLADVAPPRDAADARKKLSFTKDPEPWFKDFNWLEWDDDHASADGLDIGKLESVDAFNKALTDCKRLSAKAESLIEDFKSRTPRP